MLQDPGGLELEGRGRLGQHSCDVAEVPGSCRGSSQWLLLIIDAELIFMN